MKFFLRFLAAVAIAVLVSSSAPVAAAQPRDRGFRQPEPKIVKVIKQLGRLFGISSQADAPVPPRPEPEPAPAPAPDPNP